MKTIAIFTIALLLVFSNAQFMKKASQNTVLAEIDNDHFGNCVLSTIAIHLQTESPIEETQKLLESIKENLTQDGKDEDASFALYDANMKELIRQKIECISKTTSQLKTENSILDTNEKLLANLEKTLYDTQNSLAKVGNQLDKGNATRAQQHSEYVIRVKDHSDALAAIDEAFSLVQHLKSGTSFAQLKSHFERVQEKLQKHQNSHVLYAPIIEIMAQLASKADQESVKKILDLLSRIKKALIESKNTDQATETQQQDDWDREYTSLTAEFARLTKKKNSLENDINATHQIITTKKRLIEELEVKLLDCQTVKDQSEQELAEKTTHYNASVKERERQLDVLSRVIEHFKTKIASMKEYLKERVNKY